MTNQRLSIFFGTTIAATKGKIDRSPLHPSSMRLHRWSSAFRTSKVVCHRTNHCRWKNQTGAARPRTRHRTSALAPPHDDVGVGNQNRQPPTTNPPQGTPSPSCHQCRLQSARFLATKTIFLKPYFIFAKIVGNFLLRQSSPFSKIICQIILPEK